jgi:predicted acetyltransferase
MTKVFLMARETWGFGMTEKEYLDVCASSHKYAKGRWFVLEHKEQLVTSLITYQILESNRFTLFGIGSLSTGIQYRNKGHASTSLQLVINQIRKFNHNPVFILFSDIQSSIYKNLGFKEFTKNKANIGQSNPMYLSPGITNDELLSIFDNIEYF